MLPASAAHSSTHSLSPVRVSHPPWLLRIRMVAFKCLSGSGGRNLFAVVIRIASTSKRCAHIVAELIGVAGAPLVLLFPDQLIHCAAAAIRLGRWGVIVEISERATRQESVGMSKRTQTVGA